MIDELVLLALKGSPPATSAGDRVYKAPGEPGMTYPAITYQRIANQPVYSINGSSGIDRVRFQVNCWAATDGAARTLAAEARTAMEGASFKATLETDADDYDEGAKLYRVVMDFYCWEKELS